MRIFRFLKGVFSMPTLIIGGAILGKSIGGTPGAIIGAILGAIIGGYSEIKR